MPATTSPATHVQPLMRWETLACPDGPLKFALMHVTADPAGLASGRRDYRALVSARLVLRCGVVYAVSIAAAHDALAPVCGVVARILSGHRYRESQFLVHERMLVGALQAAGLQARVTLDRNATLAPQPVIAPARLARLVQAVAQHSGGNLAALADAGAAPVDAQMALARYRAELDAHVLAWQAQAAQVAAMATDWLAVYNCLAGGPVGGQFRTQAVMALPWLLPVLVSATEDGVVDEVAPVFAAIDQAAPLHAAVAQVLKVPREVVRWLGRRPLPQDWRLDLRRAQHLLLALSWLPPQWRPQTAAHFTSLTTMCNVLGALLRFDRIYHARGEQARVLRHAACLQRWLRESYPATWFRQALHDDVARLTDTLSDASDFLQALAQAIQDRCSYDSDAANDAVLQWASGIGLRHLMRLSHQWHAQASRDAMLPSDAGACLQWPAIVAQPWQFQRVTVIELTSSRELIREGVAMSHCVAMLDRVCHHGDGVIVALRGQHASEVSTAELRLGAGPQVQAVIEQHRGVNNSAPPQACQRALEAFVQYVNHDERTTMRQARHAFQRQQQQRVKRIQAEQSRAYEVHADRMRELAWTLASQAGTVALPDCC